MQTTVLKSINVEDIGFNFKKIGRALNEPYYLYKPTKQSKGLIVVFDPHNFFFEYSERRGWQSGGALGNPRRVFNEAVKKGQIQQIVFK